MVQNNPNNQQSIKEALLAKKRASEQKLNDLDNQPNQNQGYQASTKGDNGMSGKMWFGIIGIAIVAAFIVVWVLPYLNVAPWESKDQTAAFQTSLVKLQADSQKALTDGLAGIDGKISTALSSSLTPINTNHTNLKAQVENMATQLTQARADIIALQNANIAQDATIIQLRNLINSMNVTLQNIINSNDLLHNKLAVSGISNVTMFAANTTANSTPSSAHALASFRLKIKNNSTSALTIDTLTINLDQNFDYATAVGFEVDSIRLYRGSIVDVVSHTDYLDAFEHYKLNSLSWSIDAGDTEYVVMYFEVYYHSTLNASQQNNIVSTMEIAPTVTLSSYTLD
jgi:hypothetical protein